MRGQLALPLLALFACKPDDPAPALTGVAAIVDPGRPEHFFDTPFPSDDMLDGDGFPDLTGFPATTQALTAPVIDGWARRLEQTANGFGNLTAAYLRFEGALELPTATQGLPTDPVLMVDLETGELLPLELRFVADPMGDPFYAPNTLAAAAALGHPPRSGGTYATVVMQSAGAIPSEGWAPQPGLEAALGLAGVEGEVAVATVYTVQDVTGQLTRLQTAALDWVGEDPDWAGVQLRRVVRLEIRQSTTESGEAGTAVTTVFEDGNTETAWLFSLGEEGVDWDVDLGESWPMEVWQAEIPVPNFSGLDDRPYMSPGFGHLQDADRMSGWIDFAGGELQSEPEEEWIRVSISLPKEADGAPMEDAGVIIYDHGTAGHAYNAVQRIKKGDRNDELAARYQEAGYAIIGRDAPLYGTRYPLIDEGFAGGSLGFYNIVNLPAFRDNERQTAVEGMVVRRFVETGLNDLLPAGSVDGERFRRMGHSMGSVTSNLGCAADPDPWEGALLTGSGGDVALYFLETGLIDSFDPALLSTLFTLFGAEMPDEVTTPAVLGVALGLPEEAWTQLDRLHPVLTLFQWTMDPADPMAVARDQGVDSQMIIGLGDLQVPNFTSEALAGVLPQVEVHSCTPLTNDYDPHSCFLREEEGWDEVGAWISGR